MSRGLKERVAWMREDRRAEQSAVENVHVCPGQDIELTHSHFKAKFRG